MPFVAQVVITGNVRSEEEGSRLIEALAAALAEGWESGWPEGFGDPEGSVDLGGDEDAGEAARVVLDQQILGYPGGARVSVVLDGKGLGLEEAALSAAALGRHLTSWSPELLACTLASVQVSALDRPYDGENWLKPLDEEEDLTPRFSLADLMDSPLQELAAGYLLAGGVRSLWEPGRRVNGSVLEARDVVLGAVEHPWGRELTGVLGTLLIRAAELEAATGELARLSVTGGGSLKLASALLERARASVEEEYDDEEGEEVDFDSDQMRGHVLLEQFMEEFDLAWNQVPDDVPREAAAAQCDRQLRELLWAGMNVLATLCASQKGASNPWQLLAALNPDEVVGLLAEREGAALTEIADEEQGELHEGGLALACVWLAAHGPDVLRTGRGAGLLDAAAGTGAFLLLVNAALLMLGPGPVDVALKQLDVPPAIAAPMAQLLRALEATCVTEPKFDAKNDPYDAMGRALETALGSDAPTSGRALAVLEILHRAAALSATDANPRRNVEGYISSPEELATALLEGAGMHAGVILDGDADENALLALRALALVGWAEPALAGTFAGELPDLSASDPRIEPSARLRALRWVHDALEVADDAGLSEPDLAGEDARAVLAAASGDAALFAEWPVVRLVSAAADAAAATLAAASSPDAAYAVFGNEAGGTGPSV